MTVLDFLSPDLAAEGATWRSPLARALADAPAGVDDLSRTAVLELRGAAPEPAGAEVVRLTPERALVLCAWEDAARVRETLGAAAVDVSAAYAGLRVPGERALPRLTDLPLDRLPAVGPVAGVETLVLRDGDAFRLFFPQEYGRSVCEAVLDALEGLR